MKATKRLIDVAAAVSDGAAVDWDRTESEAAPADRRLITQLQVLERLASVHAALPSVTPFEYSSQDSLLQSTAPSSTTSVETPSTWGPFSIIERIASGTYADVYRARDPRLDRLVALKLLRHRADRTAAESEVIEEARLLARIRHPNVVAVYGAERIDGRVGISMELVDGQTLEQELRERGVFSAAALVSVGTALCRALAAVHSAGLLHRDVKAQNVMRDRDGRVLLADFGTSHEVGGLSATRDLAGTPLYLAPEVLTGQPASPASDLYSVAVVLYRLATCSFPIGGRSLRDLCDAHAGGARVPLAKARPDLPARLVGAIERGLSRAAADRHESARAFEAALEPDRLAEQPAEAPSAGVGLRNRRLIIGFMTVAVVATAALAAVVLRRPKVTASHTGAEAPVRTSALTFVGDTGGEDISRNGQLVAYLRGFDQSLWVRHLGADDETEILPADRSRQLQALTVTPDSASVDVVVQRSESSIPELRRVPLSGGTPRQIAANVRSAPGWSPDGKHMAFVTEVRSPTPPETSGIVIADADGANQRLLATRRMPMIFVDLGNPIRPAANRPAWSPDGRTIAVVGMTMSEPAPSARVVLVDVATGVQRDITGVEQRSSSPAIVEVVWMDGTQLLVNRQADNPGNFEIWKLDLTSGAFTPITHDLASYRGISIASDGQAMISTRTETQAGIWVGGASGDGMSLRIPESRAHPGGPSFDDRGDLVYSAETSEGTWVWILRSGTTTPQRIARGTSPRVTPGGDAVVLADAGSGVGLFRVDLDGSHLTQLLSAPQGQPSALTPDGRTVLFIDEQTNLRSIWAVDLRGGAPRQLLHRLADTPSVSRDGRRLLFGSRDAANDSRSVFVACDLPTCSAVQELPMPEMARRATFTWTPDGRRIAYAMKNAGGPENIWLQPLDGGPVRQLTHFADVRTITGFDWSPDGRQLAVVRAAATSDVVLLKR